MSQSTTRPLIARVADTFVAPRRLCAGFRDSTPWFDVLALSTLAAAAGAAAQPAENFLEPMENPVNRRGRPVEITSGPAEIVRYGRYLAMLSALVGHPMVAFGLAGILTLIFSVLGRGLATFRQYLAVVSHALLIPAAGTLLLLALRLVADTPLRLTPALLTPFLDHQGVPYRFLAGLDLFHVWMLGVVAVGVESLDGRRSWEHAALILFGLYAALHLASAVLSAR